MVVQGHSSGELRYAWSDLCQAGPKPPSAEFRAIYPYMTTMQKNRFNFRGGDPELMRLNLEQLLQSRVAGQATVCARLEPEVSHTA